MSEEKHHLFGPSSLRRRELCPGSYRIEKELAEKAKLSGNIALFESDSEDASRGKILHEIMAKVINNQNGNLLNGDNDDARICSDMFCVFDKEQTGCNWSEAEFTVNYSLYGDELFFGTCDVLISFGRTATIIDWKTGHNPTAPADDNIQGAAYALAAMQMFKYKSVKVVFFNPVLHSLSEATFDNAVALATYINGVIERSKAKNAPLVSGDEQCKYCGGLEFGTCPAIAAKNKELVDASQDECINIRELNDETLVDIHEKGKLVAKFLKSIDGELRRRIVESENGDCAGWTLKEASGIRSLKDLNAIYAALKDYLSADDFLSCCKCSVGDLEKTFAKAAKEEFNTLTAAKLYMLDTIKPYIIEGKPKVTLVKSGSENSESEGD